MRMEKTIKNTRMAAHKGRKAKQTSPIPPSRVPIDRPAKGRAQVDWVTSTSDAVPMGKRVRKLRSDLNPTREGRDQGLNPCCEGATAKESLGTYLEMRSLFGHHLKYHSCHGIAYEV